jgi:hypothetical protein
MCSSNLYYFWDRFLTQMRNIAHSGHTVGRHKKKFQQKLSPPAFVWLCPFGNGTVTLHYITYMYVRV